jgi:hypothetical protein
MDFLNRFSSRDQQFALVSAVVVGGLLLWSASTQTSIPQLLGVKDAVPRTEAQKTGFPSQENLPDYQTASLTNEGVMPSYSSASNFGK